MSEMWSPGVLITKMETPEESKAGITSEVPLKRHPDIWFSDGSVVLQAEKTVFRVHISQLCRRSLFFRDLFTLPQPNDVKGCSLNDRLFDECPLLFLHDPADDLAHLLNALYDGGPVLGDNDRQDFHVLSGILRLSTKYLIDSLRSKILNHLSVAWPDDLQGWDAREEVARSYESETGMHRGHRYPSPISIINLAREVDAPGLLPAAFYELSKYNYCQLFEPRPGDPLHPSPSHFSLTLSMHDLQLLTVGKECSQQAITGLIQAMTNEFYRDYTLGSQAHSLFSPQQRKVSDRICVCPAACRKDLCELTELATSHYLFDRETGFSDPLYVAEELGSLKSTEFSECKACAKSLELWAHRERERIWRMVPHWFRLLN